MNEWHASSLCQARMHGSWSRASFAVPRTRYPAPSTGLDHPIILPVVGCVSVSPEASQWQTAHCKLRSRPSREAIVGRCQTRPRDRDECNCACDREPHDANDVSKKPRDRELLLLLRGRSHRQVSGPRSQVAGLRPEGGRVAGRESRQSQRLRTASVTPASSSLTFTACP